MLDSVGLSVLTLEVDAKAVANTAFATIDNGTQRFVPMWLVIECVAVVGGSVGGIFNLGSNSTAFDNVYNSAPFPISSHGTSFVTIGNCTSIAAATALTLKVTTGATCTSCTCRVDLLGYYV